MIAAVVIFAVYTFEFPQGLISLKTGEFVAPLPSCAANDLRTDSGLLHTENGLIPCARRLKI